MATASSRDKALYSLREFTDQKAGVRRLLSLPSLQHHVLRACSDPQTHPEQLCNLLKYNPTLVAKVLNLNALEQKPIDIHERLRQTPAYAIKQKESRIVSAIISMAKGFNLNLVAEGVETKAQFRYIKGLGCYGMQGHLSSEPLSSKDTFHVVRNPTIQTPAMPSALLE